MLQFQRTEVREYETKTGFFADALLRVELFFERLRRNAAENRRPAASCLHHFSRIRLGKTADTGRGQHRPDTAGEKRHRPAQLSALCTGHCHDRQGRCVLLRRRRFGYMGQRRAGHHREPHRTAGFHGRSR